MAIIGELGGSRIVDAGRKESGESIQVPAGRQALWLIDGQAEWQPHAGAPVFLEPGEEVSVLTGPGSVQFLRTSHFVRLQAWDEMGFDLRAAAYRALMESRNQGVGQALAAQLPLQSGQIWVDMGTGTGAMVQALQERAAERGPIWILGIDRASRMVEEAGRHVSVEVPVWYVVNDLLAVTWPEGTFDGITALLLLHLVEDIDHLLAQVYRALKPGGRFAYAVSSDKNPFVHMIMRQVEGPGVFFKRGQAKIRQRVLNAGFQIERTESYQDEIALDTPQAMLELISSIGGPASRGFRSDITPPPSVARVFDLVWARKPGATEEA